MLKQAVKQGLLSEDAIYEAVMKIMMIIMK